MFFVVLIAVAFLAQCAFQLNDEHFLILLVVGLTLIIVAVVQDGVEEVLFEKRLEVLKQLLKQQVFQDLLVIELDKQINLFDEVTSTLLEINHDLVEFAPEAYTELYDLISELELQIRVKTQLDLAMASQDLLSVSDQNEIVTTLDNEIFNSL